MLNEVLNDNDITRVANIVLNEVPNSNDAMCVVNSIPLTTMGAQQFSMMAIYNHHAEKPTYRWCIRDER